MTKKDYYEILGINKNTSKEEIKKAYKKLAKRYHPDISKDKNTEGKFKEISEAYAVLIDDQKKAQYDQFSHEEFDQRFSQEDIFRDFSFGDSDSIFDIFFGGRRTQKRGSNLKYDLKISFEEAAFGTEKEIKINKNEICTSCKGSGASELDTCNTCKGAGQLKESLRTPFGDITRIISCRTCNSTGKTIKKECKDCMGTGLTGKVKIITVKIPAGVDNGTHIRLNGEGEIINGGTAGDLYIVIHVTPHKLLHREGYDIYLDQKIKMSQAILGDKIEVPILEGKVKLKIPPGTQSSTIFRLKNQGVKRLNNYGKGDQFVNIIIDIPKKLNQKQKKLIKELDF